MSLESSYRRLLFAYPRSYREHRGEEIIATLMEDATPGQTRPDRRAVADLVLGGVRERLGLHNPDGLTAGAALAAPVCLTLATIDALSTTPDPATTSQMMVVYAWVVAVAVWAAAPRFSSVVVALAVGVTGVGVVNGDAYETWSILGWGLATFIGCLSVRAPSVHRARTVRFGVPVVVAILSGLMLWSPITPPVPDFTVYVGRAGVWGGILIDLAAIGAVIVGVTFAGRRARARVAWAAFVVLGAWAASGGTGDSYLAFYGALDRVVLVSGIIAAVVGALVMVAVAVRRPGARRLHRAGGIAIGVAGAFVVLAVFDLARGGESSFWGGEDPLLWNDRSPLWLAAIGLLLLPAIADFWASPLVQRLLLVVALAGATGALFLNPASAGPIPYLLYLLVLGLCTRGGGHRDRGALLGLGLGLVTVLGVEMSSTIAVDLTYLQVVGSAVTLLVPASVVVLAAVGFSGQAWWGPTAFALAALWFAAVGGVQILPIMVVAAGLGLVGLLVARLWPAGSRPFGPMGESA